MQSKRPLYLNIEQSGDRIIEEFEGNVTVGLPLGLGKPVTLIICAVRPLPSGRGYKALSEVFSFRKIALETISPFYPYNAI